MGMVQTAITTTTMETDSSSLKKPFAPWHFAGGNRGNRGNRETGDSHLFLDHRRRIG